MSADKEYRVSVEVNPGVIRFVGRDADGMHTCSRKSAAVFKSLSEAISFAVSFMDKHPVEYYCIEEVSA